MKTTREIFNELYDSSQLYTTNEILNLVYNVGGTATAFNTHIVREGDSIQTALDGSSTAGGGSVIVYTGSYTGNVVVPSGVKLMAIGDVTITGDLTVDAGGEAAGSIQVSGAIKGNVGSGVKSRFKAPRILDAPRYLYNPAGLAGFYRNLWRTAVDQGGLRVRAFGDSFYDGYAQTNPHQFNCMAILRRMLQAHYNPAGVPGGMGLIGLSPAANSGRIPGLGFSGYVESTVDNSNYPFKPGSRSNTGAGGGTHYLEVTCSSAGASLDPTSAGTALPPATSLAWIGNFHQNIDWSDLLYTVDVDDVPLEVGTYVTPQAVDLVTNTKRFGYDDEDAGYRLETAPVGSVQKFRMTKTEDKYSDLFAIEHHNGDEYCGIQFDNFGVAAQHSRRLASTAQDCDTGGGTVLGQSAAFALNYAYYCSADHNIGLDGNATTMGIGHLGLAIIGYITNNYADRANATGTVAVYKESLRLAVQAIIAQNADASILIAPQWQAGHMVDSSGTSYALYVTAAKEVADEFSANVAVCDLFELSMRTLTTDIATVYNWYIESAGIVHTDHYHPNLAGHYWIADAIFKCLTM
jgi:hypothetical protein